MSLLNGISFRPTAFGLFSVTDGQNGQTDRPRYGNNSRNSSVIDGIMSYDREVVGLISGRVAIKWLLLGCLRTSAGKPTMYITSTNVNSAFHPSGVGKSRTGLPGVATGAIHPFNL